MSLKNRFQLFNFELCIPTHYLYGKLLVLNLQWPDWLGVLPGDVAAAPQVRRDLQALLGGRGPDGLSLLPEVDMFRAPLRLLRKLYTFTSKNCFISLRKKYISSLLKWSSLLDLLVYLITVVKEDSSALIRASRDVRIVELLADDAMLARVETWNKSDKKGQLNCLSALMWPQLRVTVRFSLQHWFSNYSDKKFVPKWSHLSNDNKLLIMLKLLFINKIFLKKILLSF